jgi:hypothetical protein
LTGQKKTGKKDGKLRHLAMRGQDMSFGCRISASILIYFGSPHLTVTLDWSNTGRVTK